MIKMKWLSFIIPMFVFFLGLFLINKSYSLNKNNAHMQEVALQTEGIIVNGGSDKDSPSKIEYRVGGKTYSIHASIGREMEGGTLPVFYDPAEPSNALVNLNYYDNTKLIGILLGGILAAVIGLVGMYRTLFVTDLKTKK